MAAFIFSPSLLGENVSEGKKLIHLCIEGREEKYAVFQVI